MIRIQLRARHGTPRRGLAWALLIGVVLGGLGAGLVRLGPEALSAAAMQLTRLVAGGTADSREPPPPAVPSPAAAPAAAPQLRGSDAPLQVLELATRLPSGVRVSRLAGDARGRFRIEGAAATSASLEEATAFLRGRAADVRLTRWQDGGGASLSFRLQGRIQGEPGPFLETLTEAEARLRVEQVRRLAEACGLLGVVVFAEPDSALGAGLRRVRWTLQAAGDAQQVRRLVQDLPTFSGQVLTARVDVTAGPTGSQLQATLDMAVTRAGGER